MKSSIVANAKRVDMGTKVLDDYLTQRSVHVGGAIGAVHNDGV